MVLLCGCRMHGWIYRCMDACIFVWTVLGIYIGSCSLGLIVGLLVHLGFVGALRPF